MLSRFAYTLQPSKMIRVPGKMRAHTTLSSVSTVRSPKTYSVNVLVNTARCWYLVTYLLSRLHYGMWQVASSTLVGYILGQPYCLLKGLVFCSTTKFIYITWGNYFLLHKCTGSNFVLFWIESRHISKLIFLVKVLFPSRRCTIVTRKGLAIVKKGNDLVKTLCDYTDIVYGYAKDPFLCGCIGQCSCNHCLPMCLFYVCCWLDTAHSFKLC